MVVGLIALPAREEAALRFYMGRNMKGWSVESMGSALGTEMPPADVYVVDLAGAGLQRNSEPSLRALTELVSQSPAVLLAPAFDTSWSSPDTPWARDSSVTVLNKPLRSEELRVALERVSRKPRSPSSVRIAPSQPSAPPEAAPVKAVSASVRLVAATPGPIGNGPVLPAQAARADGGSNLDTMRLRLQNIAPEKRPRFLDTLVTALSDHAAVELRLTVNNVVIVDVTDRWVASNTPLAVVERLCASNALASVVSVRALDDEDPLGRAHRLGLPVEPLEPFLACLEKASFGADS